MTLYSYHKSINHPLNSLVTETPNKSLNKREPPKEFSAKTHSTTDSTSEEDLFLTPTQFQSHTLLTLAYCNAIRGIFLVGWVARLPG